jgi:hypothetical protein
MVLLMRISFFRLPVTCCQDEEISPVVFLLACFSSRCASRGLNVSKSRYLAETRQDIRRMTRKGVNFKLLLYRGSI